ncbi:MAG TPA: hypothetical protein PLG17_00785 [Thermodesulfobacteriota bacterium]|nr:hypothetical protein [Deltaproteobacteria bacterium]HNU71091.1 hypothetical protein [Thermodesulfobacteriota bacterium]HOC38572.1 hypothetical protein [Thermodesulfobacteriota bacterium]HQO77026.1 hypothetical protein [Thermodesulfobacteriota bacterium]
MAYYIKVNKNGHVTSITDAQGQPCTATDKDGRVLDPGKKPRLTSRASSESRKFWKRDAGGKWALGSSDDDSPWSKDDQAEMIVSFTGTKETSGGELYDNYVVTFADANQDSQVALPSDAMLADLTHWCWRMIGGKWYLVPD